MGLDAGVRLGPYEVRGLLGAGGMGEVYRARDPRLGRDVAIKVLPASASADSDRLRRFEIEARAAGALNHPNVLAVFDLGFHDGAPYVVSELLEGETLGERLLSGGLAVSRAIQYGVQIAQGLAAAHVKGIVHRDLKPQNLFLTKDGRVKILDFGLAKLRDAGRLVQDAESQETTASHTGAGVILGTVGYMSPEQARGIPADQRSDIFSFGAVLYEMLARRRAFQGTTAAETLAAILKEDPPELARSERPLPPGLERIVRRCLEKDPEHRFQSAHDLAFALEAVSGEGAPGAKPVVVEAPPARAWLRRAAVLTSVVAAFLCGTIVRFWQSDAPPSFKQLTFRRGLVGSARFAPDGQTVVYGARWEGGPLEVSSMRLESPHSRSLGLPAAEVCGISSSGEMALRLENGTLAVAPLGGGGPREVLENVDAADWAPDGKSLAVARSLAGKSRIEFPIGKLLYEASEEVSRLRVSPKGDRVAFGEGNAIRVVDSSGTTTTLSERWNQLGGLAWSAAGDEVWFSASQVGSNAALHAVNLSGKLRLVSRVAGSLWIQDISREGHVLVNHTFTRLAMVVLPRGETRERDLSWFGGSEARDLSADGESLLFNEVGEAGGPGGSVYLRKTDGSPAIRLGEGTANELSPDGRWALQNVPGPPAKVVLLPTGPGQPRTVATPGITCDNGASWFPDGRRIACGWGREPGRDTRIFVLELEGGAPRPITPEGVSSFPVVSPDGLSVAILFPNRPDGKLRLYPVEGGEAREFASVESGEEPVRWSVDGRWLYLSHLGRLPGQVYRLDVASGRKDLWKEFAPADPAGFVAFTWISPTPDAGSYAYGYVRALADLYLADGLK